MLKFFSIGFGIILGCIGIFFLIFCILGLFFVGDQSMDSQNFFNGTIFFSSLFALPGLILIYISYKSLEKDFQKENLKK